MPYAKVNGVRLYYEDSRQRHAGNLRARIRRRFCAAGSRRCASSRDATAASRSTRAAIRPRRFRSRFPKYSQDIHVDDIAGMLDALSIKKAHVVGCSMGGYAALHFAIRYAKRALSCTAIGAGFGSDPDKREQFLNDTEAQAQRFDKLGMPAAVQTTRSVRRACST